MVKDKTDNDMEATKKSRIIAVALLVCLSGFVFSCGSGDPRDESTDTTGQDLPAVAPAIGLVSKAGQISYRKHTGQAKDAYADRSLKSVVSYPFETITIHKVTRYEAIPFSAGPFKAITALFVTEFSVDYGGGLLLTVIHEAGEYSCIDNGRHFEQGISEIEFSSHIKLATNAIEKDFTYPLYSFYVRSVNDSKFSLGYTFILSSGNSYEPVVWFPLQGKNEVVAGDIYAVSELTD
ncbi:hypothetical protein [Dysgonomonas reticulitermitis]